MEKIRMSFDLSSEAGIIDAATGLSLSLLVVGMVFGVYRLIAGPTLPDRVAALDMLAVLSVGFIAVYAIRGGLPALFDVAIALALVSFLGTVAFARYIEERSRRMQKAAGTAKEDPMAPD
jgi:multicomponent Na+:H+ antiporter subunit F